MTEGRYPPMEDLVPHRPPMMLVDAVEDDGDKTTTCSVTIREDSSFVEDGAVPAYVGLEYMAQSVAAHAGLRDVREGREIQVGYLIGARNVEFLVDGFKIGERLLVHVEHVWGDGALGQFDIHIESSGRRVAGALLNVYQGDLEEQA